MPRARGCRGPKVREVAGKHPENSCASRLSVKGLSKLPVLDSPGEGRGDTRAGERGRAAPGPGLRILLRSRRGLGKATRKVPPPQRSRGSGSHA